MKTYLKHDPKVQADVIIYHDPKMTEFSCNPEDITQGSSAGPVRCVRSLRVLREDSGRRFCFATPEERAALSAAGLLA